MAQSSENPAARPMNSEQESRAEADSSAASEEAAEVATEQKLLFGLGDRDRLFMLIYSSVFFVLITFQYVRLYLDKPEPLPWERGEAFQSFRVEVNSATWVEWMQLPGIGQTMAFRIVTNRDINGPFSSIEDVMRVDGIGPRTLDQMRPWLEIDEQDPERESE